MGVELSPGLAGETVDPASCEVMTLPRTDDELLAHADQLAARFEQYEPRPADELNANAIAALRAARAEHP